MEHQDERQSFILALDQGTTSTRAMIFDLNGRVVSSSQRELRQNYPQPGWVEHDPEEIWDAAVKVCRAAIERAGIDSSAIASMGITNQRETVVVWDKESGKPVHNAIVWQDRRTASLCERLVNDGHEPVIQAKTGLVVDAYFSASKIRWLLDHVPGLREQASHGNLLAGTIDAFLLWRLTGGVHATDTTNAARSMLFNIHELQWDDDLLEMWGIPRALLPDVRPSNAHFGSTRADILGSAVRITGIAGDQHAAMIGQACFQTGMAKCTYGTGAFLLINTGKQPVNSNNRLLTTVAFDIDGSPTYALEGSIFSAGSAIQWLRDGIGVLPDSSASEAMAAGLDSNAGLYMVPAFTGLGAPYWDAGARGLLTGITRDTRPEHLVRAALEAVGYQTLDLIRAMQADGAVQPVEVRVDGGMTSNAWLCQFIADMVGCPVQRPENIETTVLGAAMLSARGAGLFTSLDDVSTVWRADRRFEPRMPESERDSLYAGWLNAVNRARSD